MTTRADEYVDVARNTSGRIRRGLRKKAWRRAVVECHPDAHFAHGLPKEAMAILNDRLAAVNAAWESVRLERGLT